jgi:predicted metal-binding membrane protein
VGVAGGIERPTSVSTAAGVALTAILGLAAVAWVVAVMQMSGMAMGVATQLGSFGFFIAVWVAMMAAMMLPGLAPAVVRRARDWSGARAVPRFAVSYLAVWALAGVAVYEVDRPHGTLVAGVVTLAAGLYEFTPVKQHFRRRCRDMAGSGFGLGLCCLGSSVGLMAMLVALGVMSIAWMAVITVVASAQKFLPPRVGIDVPVALAITGLGLLIIAAPAAVPGLAPPM